jgi:hypothetical protein
MVFVLFFTLALFCFSRSIFTRAGALSIAPAYAFMALATLAKGLIGVVLPGLILLAFVSIRREWRWILEWRVPLGIAVFLLVSGPWFAEVSFATDGHWLKEFIWVHHVQRYTAGSGHRQPFFYYLTTFPADFSPWSLFVLPALAYYRTGLRRLTEPGALFLLLWFAVPFLFFSLSDTKRDLYLLPVFPPAALFLGSYFTRLLDREAPQGGLYRGVGYLLFGFLVVIALSLPLGARIFLPEGLRLSLPLSLIMAVSGVVGGVALWRGDPSGVFYTVVGLFVGTALYAAVWVLPFADRYKSPRTFAAEVKASVPADQPLFIYLDTMNDFNYYAEREVIRVMKSPPEVRALAGHGELKFLLVQERDLKTIESVVPTAIMAKRNVGGKTWHLLTLRPEISDAGWRLRESRIPPHLVGKDSRLPGQKLHRGSPRRRFDGSHLVLQPVILLADELLDGSVQRRGFASLKIPHNGKIRVRRRAPGKLEKVGQAQALRVRVSARKFLVPDEVRDALEIVALHQPYMAAGGAGLLLGAGEELPHGAVKGKLPAPAVRRSRGQRARQEAELLEQIGGQDGEAAVRGTESRKLGHLPDMPVAQPESLDEFQPGGNIQDALIHEAVEIAAARLEDEAADGATRLLELVENLKVRTGLSHTGAQSTFLERRIEEKHPCVDSARVFY